MTRLQWAVVVGALGLGILSQIPLHDHQETPGHDRDLAGVRDEGTVVLAVSGMT